MLHGLIAWAIMHATRVNSAIVTDKSIATVALVSANLSVQKQAPAAASGTETAAQAETETETATEPQSTISMPTPHSRNKATQTSITPVPVSPQLDSAQQTQRDQSKTTDKRTAAATPNRSDTGAMLLQAGKHCPKPEYPKISRRLLEQGIVTIRFRLSKHGHVLQPEITRTSGFNRLDIAARNALARCQFRPDELRNPLGSDWALIHYSWQLK